MVKDKYKIVIYGKNIYSEYALPDGDDSIVKIGTTKNCQVRFNKDHFLMSLSFTCQRRIRDGSLIVIKEYTLPPMV